MARPGQVVPARQRQTLRTPPKSSDAELVSTGLQAGHRRILNRHQMRLSPVCLHVATPISAERRETAAGPTRRATTLCRARRRAIATRRIIVSIGRASVGRGAGRDLTTDRQFLIGTRTHTPPGSIASRLRLCVTHVTMTYWVYIGSSRVWKCTTPHPLSPGYPSRRS